MSSGAMYQ
jgi:hypothetical protein